MLAARLTNGRLVLLVLGRATSCVRGRRLAASHHVVEVAGSSELRGWVYSGGGRVVVAETYGRQSMCVVREHHRKVRGEEDRNEVRVCVV